MFFTTIGLKKYWSSTSLPNQTSQAWYFDTRYGITSHDVKTKALNLLCVRGPEVSNNVGTTALIQPTASGIFPNPFSAHIYLKDPSGDEYFELVNVVGSLFFAGKDLQKENFLNLPVGIYFLKIIDDQPRTIPLIKE
jgi:hypothetical protein